METESILPYTAGASSRICMLLLLRVQPGEVENVSVLWRSFLWISIKVESSSRHQLMRYQRCAVRDLEIGSFAVTW